MKGVRFVEIVAFCAGQAIFGLPAQHAARAGGMTAVADRVGFCDVDVLLEGDVVDLLGAV